MVTTCAASSALSASPSPTHGATELLAWYRQAILMFSEPYTWASAWRYAAADMCRALLLEPCPDAVEIPQSKTQIVVGLDEPADSAALMVVAKERQPIPVIPEAQDAFARKEGLLP